jgi:hydrogenase nickel incorporation protein HypB
MCMDCGCPSNNPRHHDDHSHLQQPIHPDHDHSDHDYPHHHHGEGDHHHDHAHDRDHPHTHHAQDRIHSHTHVSAHNHDYPYHEPPVEAHDLHLKKVQVETDILGKNNAVAHANRALFREKGLFVLNLVSSPGSGKTTILERTLREVGNACRAAVIEGDQQTDRDAVRIAATGVPVKQVNTGAGCHLDAQMVQHACQSFDLDALDLLLVENVGNLVCPASFDLGEHHKVVVLSVTEGEDKPLKYPQMFHAAEVMLLNKVDLLPYLDFDLEACKEMARRVSPGITIFELSSRTGEGMAAWYSWLKKGVEKISG